MKRFPIIILLLTICFALNAARISLGTGDNSIQVLRSSPEECILQYRINHFDTQKVQIDASTWHHISLPGEGVIQDKGMPQLPVFNRSVIINPKLGMELELYELEYTDISLAIAPSKGVIPRNIDPDTIDYVFAAPYHDNKFFPQSIAELSEPYILRDFRGITIRITPFAYKADTNTLRIFTSFKLRVYATETADLNALEEMPQSISRSFEQIYARHFVNWPAYRYIPVSDNFGKLLVIYHDSFAEAILPWLNWKRQMGIDTEAVPWSAIGSTSAQLKSYIQARYNQDNDLSFVQLVGDAPQIPSPYYNGGGSDPSYSLVAGSDYYPDIFIGRFSAQTLADLAPQLSRSIAYERDATTTDTWLSQAMGIASAEGGGAQGDNGESDIQHMNNIRNDLLNYGYSSVDQIYDPGASAATVSNNVNAGRGFINYVGHGSTTAWGTTGFNTTNAMSLTNGHKTPFIMDIACVNGNFVSYTCFAEAWMRNSAGGAITIYASTINQSWNAPMLAQDELADLWIAEAKDTAGGYYYNSSCKMMDVYGSSTGADGMRMFITWHIFGDASLMVRSKTPQEMTVNHPSQITSGSSSIEISTTVANALVSLTKDNQIYARGYCDAEGNISLSINDLPLGTLNYDLCVTAYNHVTYIGEIRQIENALPAQPRFVAEWEPARGAIVRYPFGQPMSLLEDLSEDALLYVVVSSAHQSSAHSSLQSADANMDNIRYINADTDSYWIRDYGPWTIFDENLQLHLVDFNYNRPRPNDNVLPGIVADTLDTDLYDLALNHTGGNVMTDGMGKAMSTSLVLSENSTLSQAQIQQRFEDILGITDYQIYTDPTNTYIDHIDCWAKLLDVDKVLIRRVPSTHPQYNAIEESVSQWQANSSSFGTPYRIYRVDTPNNEPYTNSYILNGNIYVPLAGTANDATALSVYQTAMPGFNVRGYSCSSYQATDALHCRVNTIFDDQMIAVRHTPIDFLTAYQEYTLPLEIDHVHPLDPQNSFIAWSTSSSGPWQQSSLIYNGGNNYSANITSPGHQQSIYYWIQASDTLGSSTKLPLCAGLDPFVANVTIPNPLLPDWAPVSYANPPATINAQISLFGVAAQHGDLVGAYVNGECRGTDLVQEYRNSYISMQVQLAQSGEAVSFRIYSIQDGLVYNSELLLFPQFGEIIGENEPVQIAFTLDKPLVSLSRIDGSLELNWQEIPNAEYYRVLASDSPDTEFFELANITETSYLIGTATAEKRFYKVVAVKETP